MSAVEEFARAITVEQLDTDPYPVYAHLRREAPVCFIPAAGLWFVTRYDDVKYAVQQPAEFAAKPIPRPSTARSARTTRSRSTAPRSARCARPSTRRSGRGSCASTRCR